MFTVQPDLSENVEKYLNKIDDWGWNPFVINNLTCNRGLHFTMMKLWQRYNFIQRFRISPNVLMAYADILEEHYQIVSDDVIDDSFGIIRTNSIFRIKLRIIIMSMHVMFYQHYTDCLMEHN